MFQHVKTAMRHKDWLSTAEKIPLMSRWQKGEHLGFASHSSQLWNIAKIIPNTRLQKLCSGSIASRSIASTSHRLPQISIIELFLSRQAMKQSASSTTLFYFAAYTAGIFGSQDATLASALLVPNNFYGSSTAQCTPRPILTRSPSSLLIGSAAASAQTSSFSALSVTSVAIPESLLNNQTDCDDKSALPSSDPRPSVPTATQNMELVDQLKHDSDVIFSILDVDGSGCISQKEFSDHLLRVGYSESFVMKLFDEMDTNGDGVISPAEFRTLYLAVPSLRTLPGMGQDLTKSDSSDDDRIDRENESIVNYDELLAAANEVFDAADKDGNGYIDVSELKSHLSRWRPERKSSPFHYTAVARIFGLIDVNGDQSISKREFQDAFVRYSALRHALE